MKLQFIFFSIKGVLLTLGVCFQHCFYTFETMKKLLLLLFVLHFVSYGQKADGLEICFEVQKSLKGFAADKEADDALDEILAVIGAAKNFYLIPCDEINNALALTYKGERFILYDKDFIDRINKATNDWSGKFILAHEVGHHINGHTRDFLIASVLDDQTKEKQREEELEADEFAGFIVAKLGAKYNQIKELINTISSEKDDRYSTHPNRSKRLEAIRKGFDKVKILTPKQEQIVVKTPKKEENKEVVVIEPDNNVIADEVDDKLNTGYEISLNKNNKFLNKITYTSDWDLYIPYNINQYIYNKTGKIISELLLYIIFLMVIVIYAFKSFKSSKPIKGLIASEVLFSTFIIIVACLLPYISNIYNNKKNKFITSYSSSEKYVSSNYNKITENKLNNALKSGWLYSNENISQHRTKIHKNYRSDIFLHSEGEEAVDNRIAINDIANRIDWVEKSMKKVYTPYTSTYQNRNKYFKDNNTLKTAYNLLSECTFNAIKGYSYQGMEYSKREIHLHAKENRYRTSQEYIRKYRKVLTPIFIKRTNDYCNLFDSFEQFSNFARGNYNLKRYWQKFVQQKSYFYVWGKPLLIKFTFLNILLIGLSFRFFLFVLMWAFKNISKS